MECSEFNLKIPLDLITLAGNFCLERRFDAEYNRLPFSSNITLTFFKRKKSVRSLPDTL